MKKRRHFALPHGVWWTGCRCSTCLRRREHYELTRLSVDQLVAKLMRQEGVYSVNIRTSWPNELFKPLPPINERKKKYYSATVLRQLPRGDIWIPSEVGVKAALVGALDEIAREKREGVRFLSTKEFEALEEKQRQQLTLKEESEIPTVTTVRRMCLE